MEDDYRIRKLQINAEVTSRTDRHHIAVLAKLGANKKVDGHAESTVVKKARTDIVIDTASRATGIISAKSVIDPACPDSKRQHKNRSPGKEQKAATTQVDLRVKLQSK